MASPLFNDASSVMTLLSFLTFLGILWWTFGYKRGSDFDAAAALPFADEALDATAGQPAPGTERRHG